MSSFNSGSGGHEKKLETAKEKKEQADKAFQASDLPTGTSVVPWFVQGGGICSTSFCTGRIALRFYHEVSDRVKSLELNSNAHDPCATISCVAIS